MTPVLALFAAAALFAQPQSKTWCDVYPHIDLSIYQALDGVPEYDWIVRPGGDATRIQLRFSHADRLRVDFNGDLVIHAGGAAVRHTRPIAYQSSGRIEAEFVVLDRNTAAFRVGGYDPTQTLTIDPRIEMGASFGGRGAMQVTGFSPIRNYADTGERVALDRAGNIYVAGITYSSNFPLVNPIPPAGPDCVAQAGCIAAGAFAAKLDPSGSRILYSTRLGDPVIAYVSSFSGITTQPVALAVDGDGSAYITTGNTPIPGNVTLSNGKSPLAVKLDSSGGVVWSRDYGDRVNFSATDVAIEPSGKIAIVSQSLPSATGLPTTLLFTELDAATGAVLYSEELGEGSSPHLAVAADGGIIIAAQTASTNWATNLGVIQPQPGKTILLKLNSGSSKPVWATYFGGSVNAMTVSVNGDIFLTGVPGQVFPFTLDPGTAPCSGYTARLNAAATGLVYARCAGGGDGIAIDPSGNAFVTGGGVPKLYWPIQSTIIYSTCPLYGSGTPTQNGRIVAEELCGSAGRITALNPTGDTLLWSTLLGKGTATGIAVDASSRVVVTGNELLLKPNRIAGTSSSVSVVRIAQDGETMGLTLTNAASFQEGLSAPGSLASLFVTGADSSDITVNVAGRPAPILSTTQIGDQAYQVNFQIPFEMEMNAWWVEVQQKGESAFVSGPPITAGIFNQVQHAADSSVVSSDNPIRPGEIVTFYGTGFGQLTPPLQTGVPPTGPAKVSIVPVVSIGPSKCIVLYAGAAPGFLGGNQVNCLVADDVQPGDQSLQFTYDWVHLSLFFGSSVVSKSNQVIVPVGPRIGSSGGG